MTALEAAVAGLEDIRREAQNATTIWAFNHIEEMVDETLATVAAISKTETAAALPPVPTVWRMAGCACSADAKPRARCDGAWTRCNERLAYLRSQRKQAAPAP